MLLCVEQLVFSRLVQHREEKQLDASLESLVSRVAHVKNALHSFIYKLENEYERLTWWVDYPLHIVLFPREMSCVHLLSKFVCLFV